MQVTIGQLFSEIGQQAEELLHARIRVGGTACVKHALQLRIVDLQQLAYIPSVGIDGIHVAVHRLLVDW